MYLSPFMQSQIVREICSLIAAEMKAWGINTETLVAGLRVSLEIDHLFAALMAMDLVESDLTVDVVRALWAIRLEYPAEAPGPDHPLFTLHRKAVAAWGEK